MNTETCKQLENQGLFIRTFSRTLLLVLLYAIVASCGHQKPKQGSYPINGNSGMDAESTRDLRPVSFLPYWVANAQFAGYYIAKEKGFYEKFGLDVEIISYKPFITSNDVIADGSVDFSALWLVNAIELKAGGADIVNIAQESSRSSAMLITKKSSGIDSLFEMNGKRAGIWSGFELQPRALFSKYHLDVEIVPIGSSNNLFLMDGVDIINANWFDEYHSIINSGYDAEELNVFFFADYGLNFLEDGIYCLSEKRNTEPGLCADFVRATLEGWRYAFIYREETLDIVMQYLKRDNLPGNRIHQGWMLDRYRDLYLPEGKADFHNHLAEEDYSFVGNILKENNLIREVPPFTGFYQPILQP